MSSRSPHDRGGADIGPAIAIVMRDLDCDVDTAARLLREEAARRGVTIAEVAASTVAADRSPTSGDEPTPPGRAAEAPGEG